MFAGVANAIARSRSAAKSRLINIDLRVKIPNPMGKILFRPDLGCERYRPTSVFK